MRAYECRRCGVAAFVEGQSRPRCWCCGRFVKPDKWSVNTTNGATGATYQSMFN